MSPAREDGGGERILHPNSSKCSSHFKIHQLWKIILSEGFHSSLVAGQEENERMTKIMFF